jgi:hypothetical protein
MFAAFAPHFPRGHAVQVVVDVFHQPRCGVLITGAPLATTA